MLKITTVDVDKEKPRRLVLEGNLVEPWVSELQRAWRDMRAAYPGDSVVVDLANVSVISQQGEAVLLEMMSEGARFACCGVLTKHVIRQLARKSSRKSKAS